MTLHQLKVFVAVAKLGSFTQASETLHISQPSLSSLVSGLARELGAKLFERLGNKMHLTTAGERVLVRAEEILAKADGIKEEIGELTGLKKGRIRVGGSGLSGASFLTVAVQAFRKNNPEIDVFLKIEGSGVLEKQLLEGELDLAMLGRQPQSSLLAREPYHEEEVVAIAPPSHPLAKRRSVPLELLAQELFVMNNKGSVIRDTVERTFAERGLSLKIALEVNILFGGRDAIRAAVANGLGIAFVTHCHARADIKAGRLKVVKVADLKLRRTLYMATHKNRQKSPLVQVLRDFLWTFKKAEGAF